MAILRSHALTFAAPTASETARPVARVSLPLVLAPERSIAPSAPPPAPAHARVGRQMIDLHGRTIRDLRISITDRCNFRCVYCMEPDVRFAPRESLLTTEEVIRIARIAQTLGVRKIRLTPNAQEHPAAKAFRKQEKSRTLRAGVVVEPSQFASGSPAANLLRKHAKSSTFRTGGVVLLSQLA